MKHKISLLLLFLFLAAVPAHSQELLEFTEEGKTENEDGVQARQDIIQDAVEKVSSKLVREILGDSKFDRQLSTIKAKVYSNSDKYIPFIKTGPFRREGNQTKSIVTLKVNVKSLESVLQQSGFLSSTEGPAILLPAVSFFDYVNNKSLRWWVDPVEKANPFLKSQERALQESFKQAFSKQGFHVLDPAQWQYRHQVPTQLQLESLRTQDYQQLGETFKSQIVLRGDLRIESGKFNNQYRLISRLTVLHAGNGRVIADSVRTAETESGSFNSVVPKKLQTLNDEVAADLASQVHEAWSKGTLGASLIRLAIRGASEYKEVEFLKTELKREARAIKSLTERLFTKSGVEFEVDVAGGAEALAENLKKARFNGFQLRVGSVEAGRVEVTLQR